MSRGVAQSALIAAPMSPSHHACMHACMHATPPPPPLPCPLPLLLQRLFKNDRIPHGWMAVSRYEEIEADFQQSYQEGETALRTAILINCGAAEDVRALLHLEQRMNVRVVIVDSHRRVALLPCALPPLCGMSRGCAATLPDGLLFAAPTPPPHPHPPTHTHTQT